MKTFMEELKLLVEKHEVTCMVSVVKGEELENNLLGKLTPMEFMQILISKNANMFAGIAQQLKEVEK